MDLCKSDLSLDTISILQNFAKTSYASINNMIMASEWQSNTA